MKLRKLRYFTIALTAFTFLSISCSKKSNNTPAPPVTGVKLSMSTKFGNIITDNNGRSLYFFSVDIAGNSGCITGCSVTWPTFYKDNLTIGTGLTATDFATITRTDGTKQTTYKGWPVYYYASDINAGDVNGDGIDKAWVVAKNDYTVMVGSAQLIGLDGAQYTSLGVAGQGVTSYITDASGHTLYMFSKDTFNTNTFTKADFSNDTVWPLYNVTAIGSIPSLLDKTQFATINVFGKTQLVYKGHPLYFFGQDASVRGSTKGISFPTPGAAIWKVTTGTTVALQ
jgi:predicted lipoprotein with Yx(FWY)xxD motif